MQQQQLLPLRLKAEPYFSRLFGTHSCFLLPSRDESQCCLAVHDHGMIALVADRPMTKECAAQFFTSVGDADVPQYLLVIPSADGTPYWMELGGEGIKNPTKEDILSGATHSEWTAKEVVGAVQRYYGRQVLEPSIRGFLSILEKQFPRNDLYLFELLQNAVDDGATHVQFKQNGSGIIFMHDGRGFTPMDVLGLASVGLSTKTAESTKRTVGFMGIGFKAVYKRFARVVVSDATWRFCFEEPVAGNSDALTKPAHAWVMEPKWFDSPLYDGMSDSPTKSWCHFQLERPRGDALQDLKHLPPTVPPLLGKQALRNFRLGGSEVPQWTLDWDRKRFIVRAECDESEVSTGLEQQNSSFYFEKVIITESSSEGSWAPSSARYWQFLNLRFVPDADALVAYKGHTKKDWSTNPAEKKREETSFFFEVDKSGAVLPQQRDTGKVHAILPTKLSLPCPVSW